MIAISAVALAQDDSIARRTSNTHGNSTSNSNVSVTATGGVGGRGNSSESIAFSNDSFAKERPQLSHLTLHHVGPYAAAVLDDYSSYYKNTDNTCSVMLYNDGSIVLNSIKTYHGNRWLLEGWHIFRDDEGIHTKRWLEVIDGEQVIDASGGHPLFQALCSKAVNRDLPGNVKARFFGKLGVK